MTKPKTKVRRAPGSERFTNREGSWLHFNRRVLSEAANPENPLLERLKFLAIFESNLDEFYMVRVSGLIEQHAGGVNEISADGLGPEEQLDLIAENALPMRQEAGRLWAETLKPQLEESNVRILEYGQLTDRQRREMDEFFLRDVFPICTPLILDPSPTVPFISNRSLNLAVELADELGARRLGRVKVPTTFPRALRLSKRKHEYVLLEDVIRANLHLLFPGVQILGAHAFRVIRDADIEIRELEAGDLIEIVEQTLRLRRFGDPVLLEVDDKIPAEVRRTLMRLLKLDDSDVFEVHGLVGFDVLYELSKIDRPSLRYPAHHPHLEEGLAQYPDIFAAIREGDLFLHHPFDSFRTVEQFVASAARDPNVIGIKQTLYRVGAESPIVESLMDAAEAGKQVAVMVEVKARFDESNNLVWARALERAGAHVAYGFAELKTHAKLCLVVRREEGKIRTYAHIGTGNYNPSTARAYTDFGLLTCDPEITQDIVELFNVLTGFSKQRQYRKLLTAPLNVRDGIIERIHREIASHEARGGGRLLFKMNSLVDPDVIDALYEASEAGVQVDLIVRGICCLRPGVPELSERIRVVSVVGRFLEHSRAFYFENGGEPELFLGSADMMRRNLDRRIEVLAPVRDAAMIAHIRDQVMEPYFRDNQKAWRQLPNGDYERVTPGREEEPFEVQSWLMKRPSTQALMRGR